MNARNHRNWQTGAGPWCLCLCVTLLTISLFPNPSVAQSQTASSCNFSGIWFDPSIPGDGFNVYETQSGWLIYFLGYDNWGVPFWATSDLAQLEQIAFGEAIKLPLSWAYDFDGSHFDTPAPPGVFEPWGSLEILFQDCDRGTFRLEALDNWTFGSKSADVIKLTSEIDEPGLSCDYSGIWYDSELPGEGFNVYQSPVGWMLYFLTYDNFGTPVWLVSDLFRPEVTRLGGSFEIPMAIGPYSTGAYFDAPLPPNALEFWGTLRADFENCTQGVFTLNAVDQGKFGSKVTNVVKLLDVN